VVGEAGAPDGAGGRWDREFWQVPEPDATSPVVEGTARSQEVTVKLGLFAPLANPVATPEFVQVLGREAEAAGFDSLWVAEHVVLFDEYASSYPYAADGRIPVRSGSGFLDPFLALAFLAAVTERIRLGTGICLVPQRNPVYTAKEVATADWLSGGRLDFGVGVGWLAEEFAAVDTPFERRGDRCRAYLEVCRTLWCDDVSRYEGEFYRLAPCRQFPKPVQDPHPPILFGGESEAALRRVADVGQGWYGFNLLPAEFAERTRRLAELLAKRDRTLADVELFVSPYLKGADEGVIEGFAEAGADQVILPFFVRDLDDAQRSLERLATTLLPLAHAG
jgi:probable F420-dependent oxidoreductase